MSNPLSETTVSAERKAELLLICDDYRANNRGVMPVMEREMRRILLENAALARKCDELRAVVEAVNEQILGHMEGAWPGTMSITARRVGEMIRAALAAAGSPVGSPPAGDRAMKPDWRMMYETTATATKETGILMSAPMMLAYLAGRKGVTRRTRGLNRVNEDPDAAEFVRMQEYPDGTLRAVFEVDGEMASVKSPYGKAGDRLVFRETFYVDHGDYAQGERLPAERPEWADDMLYYIADATRPGAWCCQLIPECSCAEVGKPRARSPLHMPFWASRGKPVILSVRCERVQSITVEDVWLEGLPRGIYRHAIKGFSECDDGDEAMVPDGRVFKPVAAYAQLWDTLNGDKLPWEGNPYVWRVEFQKHNGANP